MPPLLRSLAVYVFLLIVFRFSGKRTLNDTTIFDLVMTLIISECVQNALVGDDFSLTNALQLLALYIFTTRFLAIIKTRFKKADKWLDGMSLILVNKGEPLYQNMQRERVDLDDIMECAREKCQLQKFKEIKYAVLERDGTINIIPWKK